MPVNSSVTVIIPIYLGLEETDKCLSSVFLSQNKVNHQIILINDASPESKMFDLLNSFASKFPNVLLIHNDENLGFIKTVNKGMLLSGETDVILLNSDTEVTHGWIDKIYKQAYSSTSIGTVTPFSNNATICNYPDLDGWVELPQDETVETMDKACEKANPGSSIEIPTAVGFCMFIKRICLNEIGLFDAINFGKGYGEENDFCMRATQKGWKHILAGDVFVYHKGEVSFNKKAQASKNVAASIMRRIHPGYEQSVADHVTKNEAKSLRLAITFARYQLSKRPIYLMFTNETGGGTEIHVKDLINGLTVGDVRLLTVRFNAHNRTLNLISEDKFDRLNIIFAFDELMELATILGGLNLKKLHIHQAIGVIDLVAELIKMLGVKYDVTLHDYYYICPRINLVMPNVGYCDVPKIATCNICLSSLLAEKDQADIIWHRARTITLLNQSNNIYSPSEWTKSLYQKIFPDLRIKVVPHQETEEKVIYLIKPKIKKIALLGVLANIKGLLIVEQMIKEVLDNNLPYIFILIGYAEKPMALSKAFIQTGKYQNEDLESLIDAISPDAILFPGITPETYSFTLSRVLEKNIPIFASNFGAIYERLQNKSNSYSYPREFTSKQILNFIGRTVI